MEQIQEYQREAIKKIEGPCVILAGAGTGKTHTIIEKLKYLIAEKTYSPEKIVCLTFSNEAANEMRRRILPFIHQGDKEPIVSTFHSFCTDLLRKHADKIGIKKEFKILLPDDAKILIHKNLKVPSMKCHSYISEIGIAKDIGITLESVESYLRENLIPDLERTLENLKFRLQTLYLMKSNSDKDQKNSLKEEIKKLESLTELKKLLSVWKAYEKLKTVKNMLDYSDLNHQALILLEKFPEIARDFDYIIVDEFQDTNKLQCDLIEKLSNQNITIVGDMNQSIYRFRGAYKDNFESFKKHFNIKNTDIYTLAKSYRSTNKILKAAYQLISHNYERKEDCFEIFNTFNKEGNNIEVYELENNKEETRKILEIIKSEISKGVEMREICVMFRTHQQAKSLKTYLEFNQIPYVSVTKKSLLKVPSIKLTKDYLTIAHKLKNKLKGGDQVWWDLFYNSSFNKEDSIILSRFIKENRESSCLSQTILDHATSLALSPDGKIKLSIILSKVKALLDNIDLKTPDLILKTYELAGLNPLEEKESLLILERFHSIAMDFSETEFSDLASFIHHLDIINALNIEIEAPELEKDGVRIMTNHSTKGLEYKTVIISNMAQKRFPMEKFYSGVIPSALNPEIKEKLLEVDEKHKDEAIKQYESENQLLEERRLCYVAFTRAKENLHLTYAKMYGEKEFFPSQFLQEINYKKSPSINFTEDLEEKYTNPIIQEPVLETAFNLEKSKILDKLTFSPSALQIFTECQKRYEYRYVYSMPDQEPISWDALKLGSFIHQIFDEGVKAKFKTEKQFIDHAKSLQMSEDWNFIEIEEALPLIKVFFHRNKDKYNDLSKTEIPLNATINNIKFYGKADRIDFLEGGGIEIVDYKTGSTEVRARYRNWQLGYYALAAKQLGLGNPKKLTLDMLKKEKPIEFEITNNGNVIDSLSGRSVFNLKEVEDDIVSVAKEILECYDKGFRACDRDSNCSFCDEFIWKN